MQILCKVSLKDKMKVQFRIRLQMHAEQKCAKLKNQGYSIFALNIFGTY